MTTIAKIAAVLSVAGFAIGHGLPTAKADEAALSVKPLKAINLAVGTKRAIGYYVAEANACQLTLQLADQYSDYANTVSEPVRVAVTVREGTSARVDSLAGPSLAFNCALGAGSMSIQPINHTAYVAPAK